MGYRQSSYDPNVYERPGKPLRPYNWVQWTGVGLVVVGGAMWLYYLLGKAGLVPRLLDDAFSGVFLPIIGVSLINSRREPGTPMDPEQMARQRRILLVVLVVTVALGVAIVAFDFGAGR